MASKGGTKRKRQRIPAVVPRIVFGTAFIGVVPACVVTACSSEREAFGVAKECFGPPCSVSGSFSVADAAFRDGPSGDSALDAPFDADGDATDDAPNDGNADADADADG